MPDTSDPKAASPKSGDQRMSVEEEDYLAREEAVFLQPLEVLRRWANVARLLHESFQGRVDEAEHQHLTREQLRDRLRDLHGEEVGTKTIERLLISFAIRVREQEATRNQEDVRADRAKNGEFKHPELPRDSHGGYYLRPDQNPIAVLYLSDEEARTLLFALRHLLHNAVEQQPALISLLAQLTTQFSGVIAAVATETMAQAHAIERKKPSSRPRPRHKELERLTTAWLKGEVVHLSYQSPWSPGERGWEPNDFENGCFQPLLLEPSRVTGATYAVGYLVTEGPPQLTTLKLDRIADVRAHPFGCKRKHPPSASAAELEEQIPDWLGDLNESWSGVLLRGRELYSLEIRFDGDAGTRVRETPWRKHVAISESAADGSRLLTATVTHYLDMVPWVLGWGSNAEVISPPELRAEVSKRLREAAAIYG